MRLSTSSGMDGWAGLMASGLTTDGASAIVAVVTHRAFRTLLWLAVLCGIVVTALVTILLIVSLYGHWVLTETYPPDPMSSGWGVLLQDGHLYCSTPGEFGVSNLMMRRWSRGIHSTHIDHFLLHDASEPTGQFYFGSTFITAPLWPALPLSLGVSLLGYYLLYRHRRRLILLSRRYSTAGGAGGFPIEEVYP